MSLVTLKPVSGSTPPPGAGTNPPRGAGMDKKVDRPQWRNHVRAGVAAGAVVVAAAIYFIWAPPAGKTLKVENASVVVSKATRGAFEDFIPVRGRVTPLMTVYLDAMEGGRVEKIHVEDGAALKAGDAIVDLSNSTLQLNVIAREAEVTEQMNNLRNNELTLERDRVGYARELVEIDYNITRLGRLLERRRVLSKNGNISEAELQNTADEHAYYKHKRDVILESQRTNDRLQKVQVAQLREATEQLQRNLDFTRRNFESLNVTAPVAGKLTAFNLEVGQSIAAGSRIGQIDDPNAYKVVAEIDEFYLGRIDVGQTASIVSGNRGYTMRVAKVYPQVKDGRFNVDLTFSGEHPGDIRRGQTLQLKLTLGDTTEALMIPDGAFYQDTGGNWLFVVSGDGSQAVRRNVRLGRRNARFIEVLDGLEAGESVVTSPYTAFLDKDRLQLTQ